MKVTVNKTELTIFQGATVADALRAYYTQQKQKHLHPCLKLKTFTVIAWHMTEHLLKEIN